MESIEIGDDVIDEQSKTIMRVVGIQGDRVICEWRAETGGKRLTGNFGPSSLKKISLQGGKWPDREDGDEPNSTL